MKKSTKFGLIAGGITAFVTASVIKMLTNKKASEDTEAEQDCIEGECTEVESSEEDTEEK